MTQTLSESVAAAIRAECARRQVPQSQLAELLGLSQAAVSRRFSGVAKFELDEIAAIAQFLDVPVTTLVTAA